MFGLRGGRGRGRGVAQKRFVGGDSTPRSNPSPFYIPFSTEKASFRIPSIDKYVGFLTVVNAL